MSLIIEVKTKGFEFDLSELCASYLFSSLYISLVENRIELNKGEGKTINGDLVISLIKNVSKSLRMLLDAGYVEPASKEVQKWPTRFERIFFENKVYKVDYRRSEFGHVVFTIYALIDALKNAVENDENVSIVCR